ncbi:MAG: UDP-N-acetylmuramoyl-L-alanine--D-glutamate ligase [Bacteroidetes bacterium]|nr:UDP-N-acetylmuramoyl-L-alanine--D-glutamate ligase [Bacteroidota bacterium]
MTETIIRRLENRHILILGFGREGRSTLSFLINQQIPCQVSIADRQTPDPETLEYLRNKQINCHFGPDYLMFEQDFDLVIKTPGIPTSLIPQKLIPKLSSQTDLFLEAFGPQTIGITGTKGKSTTSSLIHHLLKTNGKPALLTGNIGIPCFDIISHITPGTQIVFELSAHQLEHVHNSPHIGLLLNIFAEHLDHFGSFENYARAKLNLLAFMTGEDVAILPSGLENLIGPQFSAQTHFYDKLAFELPALRLKGAHFGDLARAALLAVQAVGMEMATASGALTSFAPLPHRLEPIGPVDEVLFVNDSIATIPEATQAALKTYTPDFLILGGFDRGIDYQLIAETLKTHKVGHVLVMGAAGRRMGQLIQQALPDQHLHEVENLDQAFELIASLARPGQLVLLSPAAASYDQFKNFEHRGQRFCELARRFKRKNPGG